MNLEEISAALNNEGLDYIFVAAKNNGPNIYDVCVRFIIDRSESFTIKDMANETGKSEKELDTEITPGLVYLTGNSKLRIKSLADGIYRSKNNRWHFVSIELFYPILNKKVNREEGMNLLPVVIPREGHSICDHDYYKNSYPLSMCNDVKRAFAIAEHMFDEENSTEDSSVELIFNKKLCSTEKGVFRV